MSELSKRIAVALVAIPLVVLAVRAGGWVLAALLAAAAAMAAFELYRLAEARGGRPLVMVGAALAAATVLIAAAAPSPADAAAPLWSLYVAATIAVLTAVIWLRGVEGRPLDATMVTVTGALYTGGTLVFAVFLRHHADGMRLAVSPALAGTALVFLPLLLTWLNDSFAYFGGRAWGKRKLIPKVSPGKTVAGAVVAFAGTIAAGIAYAVLVLDGWVGLPVGPLQGALIGAVISVAAQVGDLAESLLKREAGVKDSGALLPGHGGVLDRVDALLFTIPVAYWLVLAVTGGAAG